MPHAERTSEPLPLTSASTAWFAQAVPVMVMLLTAAVAIGAWLDGGDEIGFGAKWTILGVAVVASVLTQRWFGRFRHAWLDGQHLVIGRDPRRGVRVPLRDVVDVEETRWQKLKWVKVTFARGTAVGETVRFIPRGHEAWLTPWASSPVVKELRERVRVAKGLLPPREQ